MHTQVLSSSEIETASKLLQAGQLVAFPTETVYGLGAYLYNDDAIQRVFQVKGRPSDNPLIIHLSKIDQMRELAKEIPEDFFVLAEAFIPGPLTVILKKGSIVPSLACAGLSSAAFRFPSHPVARELISMTGPLVAPSANISGKPSSTNAQHVLHDFQGKIAAVIDAGPCSLGIESTVVSFLEDVPTLLRPGSITKEDMEGVLKKKIRLEANTSVPICPGLKYRHYAPNAKILLFYDWEKLCSYIQEASISKRMLLSPKLKSFSSVKTFPLNKENLYACLRQSDAEGYEEILVFCDETIQNDLALMNRLKKASS